LSTNSRRPVRADIPASPGQSKEAYNIGLKIQYNLKWLDGFYILRSTSTSLVDDEYSEDWAQEDEWGPEPSPYRGGKIDCTKRPQNDLK